MPPPVPPVRLLSVAALVLVWAVPVDPQWRAFRTVAETMVAPYTRDFDVPLNELRYPASPRTSRSKTLPTKGQPPRNRRQYRGYASQKQSTFGLLRQLIAETANETRSAFNQIGDILGSQFSDAAATPRPSSTTTTTTTPSSDTNSTARTTEAPFRISRQELLAILQRNAVGIGRLFRREYDQAIQDSKVNSNRFKQEFQMVVAPFLEPATTQPTTTTTRRT